MKNNIEIAASFEPLLNLLRIENEKAAFLVLQLKVLQTRIQTNKHAEASIVLHHYPFSDIENSLNAVFQEDQAKKSHARLMLREIAHQVFPWLVERQK